MDGKTMRERLSVAWLGPRSLRLRLEQQVSWLPDHSWANLPARETRTLWTRAVFDAVDLPPSSPDTVAGAAPVFHRLPCCLVRAKKRVVIVRTHYSSL